MSEHFIKNIEIKNFKCFKDFKAEGFARVNLIGGKNNVGKTAFMEACYINSSAMDIKNFVDVLFSIKYMRENMNILVDNMRVDTKAFIELSDGLNLASNINQASFYIQEQDGVKFYDFLFNAQHINVNLFSYTFNNIENIRFIDSFGLSNNNIITNYSAIQKKDEEKFLNTILKEFDNSIESFKVFGDLPMCKVNKTWLEVTEFGDGVRHIISTITALSQCANGYLFIDEVENGIHYSNLDKVWEVILTVSKEQNVQVFATTHSKECIESYARVAKKLEDEEITFIELGRNDANELTSIVYDFEAFTNEVEQNQEIRGW